MTFVRFGQSEGGVKILGAILAGGQARRFGSDKALALLDGVPLIEHVAVALGAQTAAVAVCGRTHAGLIALADRPAPGLGPLGGLAAALHHAACAGYTGVVSVGCDVPRLPADLVATLIGDAPAVVAAQPVIGWWPAPFAARLDAHLASGADRSLRGWAAAVNARAVALGRPLANVNRTEDLAALAARRG